MKRIYLELNMGCAGDMLMAALLELHPDPDGFMARMRDLNLPGVHAVAEPSVKCGISGTHIDVHIHGHSEDDHHHHDHHHSHSGLSDIESLIQGLPLPEGVIKDALSVYRHIADAESKVHGVPVSQIHFHEVGSLDAVFDIACVCLLISELLPDEILASRVKTGYGTVKCQHGLLPVPAPATAEILMEAQIPFYAGKIEGELLTPTGAALLAHFVKEFCEMPPMRVSKIGYGMGKKDFPAANCVRAFLGETDSTGDGDEVVELTSDIDDQSAEALAYAQKILMEAGALDAILRPAIMKKGRPGTTLSVLVKPEDEMPMTELIFRHTTTIGVRVQKMKRYKLTRTFETMDTPMGAVRKKMSAGFGVTREKLEFEDLARIAKERGMSLDQVIQTMDN